MHTYSRSDMKHVLLHLHTFDSPGEISRLLACAPSCCKAFSKLRIPSCLANGAQERQAASGFEDNHEEGHENNEESSHEEATEEHEVQVQGA